MQLAGFRGCKWCFTRLHGPVCCLQQLECHTWHWGAGQGMGLVCLLILLSLLPDVEERGLLCTLQRLLAQLASSGSLEHHCILPWDTGRTQLGRAGQG